MSEYTMEEARLDVDRDYYEALGESDHIFAPYVKHVVARYYADYIIEWHSCVDVLNYVLNDEISGDSKLDYLVKFHAYEETKI